MKLYLAILPLALAACTTTAPTAEPGRVPTPETTSSASGIVATADKVILTGQRAFGAAEVVYTAAAQLTGKAVDNGLIKGATATRVRAWNAEARVWLIRGKTTADAAEKARSAAGLFDIANNLNALTGGQ